MLFLDYYQRVTRAVTSVHTQTQMQIGTAVSIIHWRLIMLRGWQRSFLIQGKCRARPQNFMT